MSLLAILRLLPLYVTIAWRADHYEICSIQWDWRAALADSYACGGTYWSPDEAAAVVGWGNR